MEGEEDGCRLRRDQDMINMAASAEDPKLRKRPIETLVRSVVSDDGGPLLYHGDSEAVQASFDSTCRKLARFFASQNSASD